MLPDPTAGNFSLIVCILNENSHVSERWHWKNPFFSLKRFLCNIQMNWSWYEDNMLAAMILHSADTHEAMPLQKTTKSSDRDFSSEYGKRWFAIQQGIIFSQLKEASLTLTVIHGHILPNHRWPNGKFSAFRTSVGFLLEWDVAKYGWHARVTANITQWTIVLSVHRNTIHKKTPCFPWYVFCVCYGSEVRTCGHHADGPKIVYQSSEEIHSSNRNAKFSQIQLKLRHYVERK